MAHNDLVGLFRQHSLQHLKKVGEGAMGKAILVQNAEGAKLICKMVDVSKATTRERQDAVKEGRLLASLKHPYIVRYRESFTERGWLCILMDYCEAGDLTAQIQKAKRERKAIPEEQVLKWMCQALLAMKYIHANYILHRDLKPSNFFLSQKKHLKMGDFGIAKVLSCTMACARTVAGTPYYLSPEVCQEKPYTWPSDIWAMGCITYELCALHPPFEGASMAGLVNNIIRGRLPTVPSNYSRFLQQVTHEMLNRTASARPSPSEILQRPAMHDIMSVMLDDELDKVSQSDLAAPAQPPPHVPAADNDVQGGGALAAAELMLRGPYSEHAGKYRVGDPVEYNSSAHKEWLPATVTQLGSGGQRGDGAIVIDLKPNTWLSREEQAKKVRPRRKAVAAAAAPPAAVRVAASPQRQRSPAPSARGRGPTPQVAASPQRQRSPAPSARGMGPTPQAAARSPSTPRRQLERNPSAGALPAGGAGTPLQQRSPSPTPSDRFGRGVGNARCYARGDLVEYFSATHKDWLPATVANASADGHIIIDLKPNTWLSKEQQESSVRPRRSNMGDAARNPSAHASPMRQHSPSLRGVGGRVPSRDASPLRGGALLAGGAGAGVRQATPRRSPSGDLSPRSNGGPGSRAASPQRPGCGAYPARGEPGGTPRARPPGLPPRASESPFRRRNPAAGAAGHALAGM